MAGLVTVVDLDARKVRYEDAAQAQAAIDDASGVARTCVAPELDEVQAPDPGLPAADQGVPAAVVAVVVNMVRRVIANPRALAQESLGDYSYSTGGQGVASLLPTAREKRLLRRAVGKLGAGTLTLEGDLPLQPSDDFVGGDGVAGESPIGS